SVDGTRVTRPPGPRRGVRSAPVRFRCRHRPRALSTRRHTTGCGAPGTTGRYSDSRAVATGPGLLAVASRDRSQCSRCRRSFPHTAAGQSRIPTGFPLTPRVRSASTRPPPAVAGTGGLEPTAPPCLSHGRCSEHRAGVEQPLGVERVLDAAGERHDVVAELVREPVLLEP